MPVIIFEHEATREDLLKARSSVDRMSTLLRRAANTLDNLRTDMTQEDLHNALDHAGGLVDEALHTGEHIEFDYIGKHRHDY